MSKELVDFINILLLDGEISEKEKTQIFEKANKLGIPEAECEVILESLMGQVKKKTVNPKKSVKKKVPKYQKKATLNKVDELNQKIEKELKIQENASIKTKSLQSEIDNHHNIRNSLIKEAENYINLRKQLKSEYEKLLKQLKSNLENRLGSEVLEESKFESKFLYRANKNSITTYFQNATWNIGGLTTKRKLRYYFFTGVYYILFGYIWLDWVFYSAEDGGVISKEQWMGFKWWQILIASLISMIIGQSAKSKIDKNNMDFNQEDIAKNLETLFNKNVKDQIELYNKLHDELNSNNNLKSRKFN